MSSTLFQPINMLENTTVFTSHQQAAPTSSQPESTTVIANIAPEPDERPAYLDYKPEPYLATDRNSQCYRTYLDKLGFKKDEYSEDIRRTFVKDLRAHVCAPETMYMRREDNPAAFAALIKGFLQKHGHKYWGTNRTHLAVTDISKGFSYPRDADREGSRYDLKRKPQCILKLADLKLRRFMTVLDELFQYKARCSRNNDVSNIFIASGA